MNWEILAPIILTIVLLIAGGYIRRLLIDTRNLIDVIIDAIADGEVDDKELASILTKWRLLSISIKDVIQEILSLRRR